MAGGLFVDEPTVALDVEAYDHFCFMCRIARRRNSAMIISSHQLRQLKNCVIWSRYLTIKLCLLDDGSEAKDGGPWTIVTHNGPGIKEIIERVSGSVASYTEGAWRVRLQTPRTMVPEIIAKLVQAGCGILEVRPEKTGP